MRDVVVEVKGGGVGQSSPLVHTLTRDDPLHSNLYLLTTDSVLQAKNNKGLSKEAFYNKINSTDSLPLNFGGWTTNILG